MLRRDFIGSLAVALASGEALASPPQTAGERLAAAAKSQLDVTREYDPKYVKLTYPNGDVDRKTGVCADVIVRAYRDALKADLQELVHEDMLKDFASYPSQAKWGLKHPDANIDHRRVPNLEIFWKRAGAQMWLASKPTVGDGFPGPLLPGDLLTWLLDGHLPHVGIVVGTGFWGTRIVQNIGAGVREDWLAGMSNQPAHGHYRWRSA